MIYLYDIKQMCIGLPQYLNFYIIHIFVAVEDLHLWSAWLRENER